MYVIVECVIIKKVSIGGIKYSFNAIGKEFNSINKNVVDTLNINAQDNFIVNI
jgi:hypothetical protein